MAFFKTAATALNTAGSAAGAPIADARAINPWTGQPDPTHQSTASGGDFYTNPNGELVYVPEGAKVGSFTDPKTGKVYDNVVLKQTEAGWFPYADSKDSASAAAAAEVNAAHNLNVTTAGNNIATDTTTGQQQKNAGTNSAVTFAGNILGKTLIPAGEKLGLLPPGSSAQAADVEARPPGTGGGGGGGTGGGSSGASGFTSGFVDGLVADANAAGTRAAPQIAPAPTVAQQAGPSAVQATQVSAPQSDFRSGLVAGTVSTPGAIQTRQVVAPTAVAGQAANVGGVTATTFNAPQNSFKAGLVAGTVDSPGTVKTQAIGTPDTVHAERIGPQNLDTTYTAESRAQFQDALAKIKVAAEGGSPSAAEWLLQKGIDQNVGTAYGLAASLQGRNPGQAMRAGAISAKDAIAKSSADMAALRASEQATARGQLGEFTKGLNAADIQQAGLQLGANVDVSKANQATGLQGDISNQITKLDASKASAANELQASIANVQNELTRLTGNRDAALKAGMQNQADSLTAAIENQRSQLTTLQSNQSALLEAAKATAANATTVETVNAQLRTTTAIANQTAALDASKANASNELQARIQDTLNQIAVAAGNRDAALRAGEANQAADMNVSIANLNAQKDTLLANQSALLEAAKASASNVVAMAGVNANIGIANAKNATDVSIASVEAQLKQMGLDDAKIIALKGLGLDAMKAAAADARAGQEIDMKKYAADLAFKAELVKGTAQVGSVVGGKLLDWALS